METEQTSDQYPQIWQVIVVIIVTLVIILGLGVIGTLAGARVELFLLEAFIALPAVAFALYRKFPLVKLFRLRLVNRRTIVASLMLGLAVPIVLDEVDRIVQIFFPMPEAIKQALEASLKFNTTGELLIIIFSAVFLAAIMEELLVRGFVQTSFESHFDVTKAVMSSALIFTIIHFNPWWSIQVMIIGIILGVMAWKSDSVIPPMILHFMNNAIALIFSNATPESYQWYLYKDHVSIPIVVSALVFSVYGMKLFYRSCELGSVAES